MAATRKNPKAKAKARAGSKANPKVRSKPKAAAKSRPERKAKARWSFAFGVGHLFYLYFALLPLFALAALNFDTEIWSRYSECISVETHPSAHFLYHLFCVLTFFVSAIFSVLLIRTTPLPKSMLLTLILIFDAPVFFAIDYACGGRTSPGQAFMGDLVLESLAFALAVVLVRNTTKKLRIFFIGYFLAVAFSFYGVDTARTLLDSGFDSQLLAAAALLTTTAGFFWVLKTAKTGKIDKVQVTMSNFAMVVMFFTWVMAAAVLFAAV